MALSKSQTLLSLLVGYLPLAFLAVYGLPQFVTQFYQRHPIELMFGTFAVPMVGLVYTGPDSSIRPILVILVTLGMYCYHETSPNFMPNRARASALDGPFMLLYLTTVDVFLLQRSYLKQNSDNRVFLVSERNGNRDNLERNGLQPIDTWKGCKTAAHTIFSYRAVGTTREAKNVPKFYKDDPTQIPSRLYFLLKRGAVSLGAFIVVDYLSHQPPPPREPYYAKHAALFPAKADITYNAIFTRVLSTLIFWTMLRIIIGLIYNLTSVLGVATFLTEPADWPPYFGDMSEASTLRGFWSSVPLSSYTIIRRSFADYLSVQRLLA